MRRRNRSERGEGQAGCLVGVVLLALGLFVAYKLIPIKIRAAELRQTVVDESKSAGTHDDKAILGNILAKANEQKLPVNEENVKIVRAGSSITVDVDYVVPVDFPGKTFNWHLHHHAENPIF